MCTFLLGKEHKSFYQIHTIWIYSSVHNIHILRPFPSGQYLFVPFYNFRNDPKNKTKKTHTGKHRNNKPTRKHTERYRSPQKRLQKHVVFSEKSKWMNTPYSPLKSGGPGPGWFTGQGSGVVGMVRGWLGELHPIYVARLVKGENSKTSYCKCPNIRQWIFTGVDGEFRNSHGCRVWITLLT